MKTFSKSAIILITIFYLFTFNSYSQQPSIEQINTALSASLKETNYDSIYNALRLKKGDRIKVFVNFTIDEEGKVTNIKTRAPYPFFEQEAVRLMERLPSFTPIIVNGEAKRMNFSLPITFVVESERKKRKG
jgi:TonB family protein